MCPALFLDRDGVLIVNRPKYVRSWEDVEFIPTAIAGGQFVSRSGHPIVVVTNQAVVGRGLLTLDEALAINERIMNFFRANDVNIIASYVCPHRHEDDCDCRKPKPGMLLRAASEFGIDLQRSVMVGDSLRDLLAAESAGVKGILVRTGMGSDQEADVLRVGGARWPVFNDLMEAAPSILVDLEGAG